MADKPKTYAQQVQELKEQKEELLTDLADAERQLEFIPELQQEISDLKEQLALKDKQLQSGSVNSKAQNTDLLQRAESAEQGNKNAQAAYRQLKQENESLQQQLDILSLERDKNSGKEQKIQLLSEELKAANLRAIALNQQLRDRQVEFNEAAARTEKEVLYLRELSKAQGKRLEEVYAVVQAMPDVISSLKDMINRW